MICDLQFRVLKKIFVRLVIGFVISPVFRGALLKNHMIDFKSKITIQTFVILKIYQYHPFRADISPMYLHTLKTKPEEDGKNYLWVWNKKAKFVLNDFKTFKQKGQVTVEVSNPELNKLLNAYSRYLKMLSQTVLFIDKNNKPITSHSLSTLFSSYWEHTLGKKFNITTNRKRIVSESPDVQKYVELRTKIKDLENNMQMT